MNDADLFDAAIEIPSAHSAIGCWDHVFDAAPGILALNKKIKQALDPANLLAPGRYGI